MTNPCSLAVMVLSAVSPLLAQEGRIRIVVKHVSDSAVGGASISVAGRRFTAGPEGVASLSGLPAGRYELLVMSPGYKTWRRNINVSNGPEANLDVRLETSDIGNGTYVRKPKPAQLGVEVRDAGGGAIVNADVRAKCANSGSAHSRTDAAGAAKFDGLTNGYCEITVRSPGFREWKGSSEVASAEDDPLQVRLEVSDPGTKIAVRPKPAPQRFWDWLSSCTRK